MQVGTDKFGFLNTAGKFRVMLPDGSIYRSNRTYSVAKKLVYVYKEGKWETPTGRPANKLKTLLPILKRALKRMQKSKIKKHSFETKLPKKAKPTIEKTKRIDKISSRKQKRPLAEGVKIAKFLVKHLKNLKFKGIVVGGSIRRKEPEVGDIDVMAIGNTTIIKNYEPFDFIKGKDKSATFMFKDHQVNLYTYEPKYYGSMLLFLTGPGEYNIALRRIAKSKNMKLSQYGLVDNKTGKIYSKTEEEIYKQLGKSYKDPTLRGKKDKKPKPISNEEPPDKVILSKLDDTKHSIASIKKYISTLSEKQLAKLYKLAKNQYYNT